jgi:galactitol PTS system EIIA component
LALNELLDCSLCINGLEAKDAEDALRQLSRQLNLKSFVNEEFEENIIIREREFPTGLPMDGYKAALPHTYPRYVNKSVICIAALKKPVKFFVMGSPEETILVHVIIMLAIKDSTHQVDTLKQLINNVIQDSNLIDAIVNAQSGQEIYSLIMNKIGNTQ